MANSIPASPATREELYAHADNFLGALAARDPSRVKWAEHVVFTENNVQLGGGRWCLEHGNVRAGCL